MALNFFLKRSGTASKRPDAVNMAFGELDLNYSDNAGGLFYRNSANSVVKVGPAEVGASAPNSSPVGSTGNSVGEFWYDTGESVLKIWDGSSWVNTVSTTAFLPLSGGTMTGDIVLSGAGVSIVFDDASSVEAISDSTSLTSSTTAASSTAVKAAYDLADAALPLSGGTMTGVVTFDGAQILPVANIQDGTLTQKGVVQLEDSTSSTSTTLAATPNSVKTAWDLANAALPLSGGTMSGDMYLFSQVPTDAAMPASKYYADQIAMGYKWQTAVAAATTAAFAGTVTYSNGTAGVGATLTLNTPITAIDGVTITSTSTRILVKNQASQLQNGIYTWTSGGATTVLTRATDSDEVSEMQAGNAYYVNGGTVNGSQTFVQVPTLSAIGTSPITYSLSSVRPFHKYSNEWNVDPVAGDDSNGTGSEEQPYKTIAKALSMAGGSGGRIVLHQGTYTENVTFSNLNLDVVGATRAGANLSGTVAFTNASSSTRVFGVQFTNTVTHSGAGGVYIYDSTFGAVNINKSGNGYLELNRLTADSATLNVTGAGYVNVFNGRLGVGTINNASAVVTYLSQSLIGPTVVTAGTMQQIGSVVFAATESGNAITASAGTNVLLRNSGYYTPSGLPARVALSGNYSFDDVTLDRTNSTLGTNLGTVARFDSIDSLGAILANGSAGTAGQVLTSGGPGAAATWTTSAAGTVTDITAGAGLCGGTISSSGTISLDSACAINPTTLTAKGDILAASAAATPVALPVGSNGQVLAANSSCSSGLNWVTPCAGTVTSVVAGTGLSGGTITGSGTVALCNASVTAIGGVLGCTNASSAYLGCNAGVSVIGTCNVFLGAEAACTVSSGSCSVVIGAGVQPLNANAGCQLAIGAGTICWLTGTSSGAIKPMKGIIDCNNACGSAGQVLASNGSNALCWTTLPPSGIPCACILGKGALVTGTAASTPVGLAVGTDGQALVACAACPSGLTWTTPATAVCPATSTVAGIVLGCTTANRVALGCNSLLVTTAVGNTAIGIDALRSTTSGDNNTALGNGALACNTTGANNAGIGPFTLANNTTGFGNVAVGRNALYANTTGCRNVAVGLDANTFGTTGSFNTYLGHGAACCATTGNYNTAIGQGAYGGYQATPTAMTGCAVTAVGHGALRSVTGNGGSGTVAVGVNAGASVTTGISNIFVGCSAGQNITTGCQNVIIGHLTNAASATGSCQLAIGFSATDNWLTGDSSKNIQPGAGIKDCSGSVGTAGQILSSTGTAIKWRSGTVQQTASCTADVTFSSEITSRGLSNGDSLTVYNSNSSSSQITLTATSFTNSASYPSAATSTQFVLPPAASATFVLSNSATNTWYIDSYNSTYTSAGVTDPIVFKAINTVGNPITFGSTVTIEGIEFSTVTFPSAGLLYNAGNYYNNTSRRYTPLIAGYYRATARIGTQGGSANEQVAILKNGTSIEAWNDVNDINPNLEVNTIVYLNGSTDYIQVGTVSLGVSTTNVTAASEFSVTLIEQSAISNGLVSAGTIQSVGWSSTGGVLVVPGATSVNNVSYQQVGTKQWQVVYTFTATANFSNVGSGTYLFTLPNGLRFDTTLSSQRVINTASPGASHGWRGYFLPAAGTVQVAYANSNNGSAFGAGIIPYDATRFRIFATDSSNGAPQPISSGYYLNNSPNFLSFSVGFTFTSL